MRLIPEHYTHYKYALHTNLRLLQYQWSIGEKYV